MSLVKDTIPNFIGGVSQQPDKIMFPNQAKSLINYHLNPTDGLLRRPPTEHVARLMDAQLKHPFVHTIIKENEQYQVILTGDGVKVFDLDGNEKAVTFEGSEESSEEDETPEETNILQYITTEEPLRDLYAATIADYTFILNKTITAALKEDLFENPYPASALIFIKQGDYATDYKIKINGTERASYTTSSTDVATTGTNRICTEIYNKLNTSLGTTNWELTRQGSVILIENKNGEPFEIQSEDSNADRNLWVFYNNCEALNFLPLVSPNGYILKIIGEDINIADDYYVQFKTADGSSFGTGSWQECSSPNIEYKIDPATMPHALVREADGTFTFKTIDWANRHAGDEDSAPTPSFIGNTIQDIFTHKGRLALVSGDRSTYSDTQDIFSFFKRTTLTELETDPIDVGSNSKMVLLKYSLPFNELLLLFSETSVFSIKGGDVFSNSTVACDLTMEYPCSRNCRPINSGSTGFFLFENGDYSRVMEIYLTSTLSMDARDITEQVPSYLPSKMYKIAGSTANNIACFLSTKETDNIYIYNYYYSSEQKVQSAWSKWNFCDTKILNVDFNENWLYLTTQYEDGIYLEKMNFSAKNKEPDLDFLFFIDRKFYLDENSLIIDDGNTTFTKPYEKLNGFVILDSMGFPVDIVEEDNETITVEGEYNKLIVGIPFVSTWVLPKIYVRQQTSNGAVKVKEGILMLKDLTLSFAQTGHFKIKVKPKYETSITSEFEFTGKICGMDSSRLEQIPVSDDTFLLPIMSYNEDVEITIINDSYLPSCFLSLEWLGDFIIRGQ